MVRATVQLTSALFNHVAFRASLKRVVTRAAFDVEAEAKRSIQQGTKSGRVYRRRAITRVVGARRAKAMGLKSAGGKKFVVGFNFHRASAPGQAPASDSSNLANSIVAKPAQLDGGAIKATVTVNASYGRALELGTTRMKPRPYLAPAMKKQEPKFRASVNGLLAVAVK